MATLNELIKILQHGEVTISSLEIMLLLATLTICLLLRANRIGMLLAYVYVYRMGWTFFEGSLSEGEIPFFAGYVLFGLLVLVLVVVSMFHEPAEKPAG